MHEPIALDESSSRFFAELREEIGLSDTLIRISIGIENVEDLISDLAQGLQYV